MSRRKPRRPNLDHLKDRLAPDSAGLRARIRELEQALKPFAELELSPSASGPDIWFYQGMHERHQELPHLKVRDLIRAREALGLAEVIHG